ncbi:MAG: iron ABC transporter permease [Oscillospiraceae bacterium]|nr:iron ABC transporter permease [Oscillospiraceae bacterium]
MKVKIIITICASLVVLVLGIALGSVNIPPGEIFAIIRYRLTGTEFTETVNNSTAIVWNLRLPRALLAFIAGGALSVSGAVMQSVLRNPLASSFTLGVSSGASLGAGIVILLGITIPVAAMFTLPVLGFAFGIGTIFLVIGFASKVDSQMDNNTIILTGMVFSLFVNAITTLMSALARQNLQQLILWQMGSFSMRGWEAIYILAPAVVAGVIFITHFNRELDIMTFGEEQAKTMGVNLKRVKWTLLILSAALTGGAIAFVGVIGFVDLVAPHIVRRIFGSSHRYVIPLSALFGGAFMVICDLVARTIIAPRDLPVGAVTAFLGTPFFAYIYFSKRAKKAQVR